MSQNGFNESNDINNKDEKYKLKQKNFNEYLKASFDSELNRFLSAEHSGDFIRLKETAKNDDAFYNINGCDTKYLAKTVPKNNKINDSIKSCDNDNDKPQKTDKRYELDESLYYCSLKELEYTNIISVEQRYARKYVVEHKFFTNGFPKENKKADKPFIKKNNGYPSSASKETVIDERPIVNNATTYNNIGKAVPTIGDKIYFKSHQENVIKNDVDSGFTSFYTPPEDNIDYDFMFSSSSPSIDKIEIQKDVNIENVDENKTNLNTNFANASLNESSINVSNKCLNNGFTKTCIKTKEQIQIEIEEITNKLYNFKTELKKLELDKFLLKEELNSAENEIFIKKNQYYPSLYCNNVNIEYHKAVSKYLDIVNKRSILESKLAIQESYIIPLEKQLESLKKELELLVEPPFFILDNDTCLINFNNTDFIDFDKDVLNSCSDLISFTDNTDLINFGNNLFNNDASMCFTNNPSYEVYNIIDSVNLEEKEINCYVSCLTPKSVIDNNDGFKILTALKEANGCFCDSFIDFNILYKKYIYFTVYKIIVEGVKTGKQKIIYKINIQRLLYSVFIRVRLELLDLDILKKIILV